MSAIGRVHAPHLRPRGPVAVALLVAAAGAVGCRTYADMEAVLARVPVLVVSGVAEASHDIANTRPEPPPHRRGTAGGDPFGLAGVERRHHFESRVDVIAVALGSDDVHFEDLVARCREVDGEILVTVEAPLGRGAKWALHLPPMRTPETARALDAYVGSATCGPVLRASTFVYERALSVRAPRGSDLRARVTMSAPELAPHARDGREPGVQTLALARELFEAPGSPRLVWEVRWAHPDR